MANSKFIRLHNSKNNTVTVLNIDYIVCIDTDEENDRVVSTIYLNEAANMEAFNVNETPEKIYGMIEEISK